MPLTSLEMRRTDPNYQLVDDFSSWFHELLEEADDDEADAADEELEEDEEMLPVLEEASWRNVGWLLLEMIAFATSYGAVVGAAVAVMPWAKWAACVGGGVWGIFVAVAQARVAHEGMPLILRRFTKGLDGMIGLITGAVQGAFFGIMAVALVGAALGGIAGVVIRQLIGVSGRSIGQFFPGIVLIAAACGVAAQAFYMDHAEATTGLWYGALVGLGSGLFLCLASLPLAFLTVRRF